MLLQSIKIKVNQYYANGYFLFRSDEKKLTVK